MSELDPIPALKSQVAAELARVLKSEPIDHAAVTIHSHRTRVAEIRRGDLKRFSLEQLIRFAHRARLDVVLSVTPRARTRRKPFPLTEQK